MGSSRSSSCNTVECAAFLPNTGYLCAFFELRRIHLGLCPSISAAQVSLLVWVRFECITAEWAVDVCSDSLCIILQGYIFGGVIAGPLGWRAAFLIEAAAMVPFVLFCALAPPMSLRGMDTGATI